MPVTSRKLLVKNISGAGKKGPLLKFSPTIRKTVNPNCDCKTSSCVGKYLIANINPSDSAVCNGSICYLDSNHSISGLQINAIPGTSYTTDYSGSIFIVNCTSQIVYCNTGAGSPFTIVSGESIMFTVLFHQQHTYTFTSTPPSCIGTYPTEQIFGDATCGNTNCSATNGIMGVKVLAIPGTTYVLQAYINIFMVNCSASNVYWKNNVDTPTYTLISPGHATINRPNNTGPVTYTFSNSP